MFELNWIIVFAYLRYSRQAVCKLCQGSNTNIKKKNFVIEGFKISFIWNKCISVQFNSVTQSCPTLGDSMNCSMPGLPVHHQLPELTQTHVHWVNDAIQPSHPLSSLSPPALNLSQHQGLFQWVSSLHPVDMYWSFSFNISPSSEHPGLSSFSMDWLDLLAAQGTLKSLLQHHSSKVSFFCVQLSVQSNSHIHQWPLEKP